jgi:hypothetical protein
MKTALLLSAAAVLAASTAFAQTAVPVGNFSGIHATDGAAVTIRHGSHQQVTIVKGDPRISVVEVRGDSLEVETCRHTCPRHYGLEVEVVTPNLAAVSADDGASIEARDDFPSQERLAVKAVDGGSVNTRAIPASHVDADADDGGRADVRATVSLNATAEDGGAVNYWGKPSVRMRAEDGGVVSSGD